MEYIGKYMGYVRDASDPKTRARLRLFVPEVMGANDDTDHWTDWALPCFPWFAHNGLGTSFVPPVGNDFGVWVEFRHGDVRFPIWVGVFIVNSTADLSKLRVDAPQLLMIGDDVQARSASGVAVSLAKTSELNALASTVQTHVHPGITVGGASTLVTVSVMPTATGTRKFKGE